MAYLDNIANLVVKHQGRAVFLRAGQTINMHTPSQEVALSDQPLSSQQIHNVILEIIPAHLKEKLRTPGAFSFEHAFSKITLNINVNNSPSGLMVRLSPMESTPEPVIETTNATTSPKPESSSTERPVSTATSSNSDTALEKYFHQMLDLGASDLHLSSLTAPMVRLHGSMQVLPNTQVLQPDVLKSMLLKIMPERNKQEFLENWDTDFSIEIKNRARLRSNIFIDNRGPGAVFRQIPHQILSAKQLGLPESVLRFGELRKGLVVVTGPTGSGKSTTLAALLDYINENRDEHIITIEDPVEFVHPNKKCLINHREVGTHTKTFKAALRAALREDPDIIMVGEMRDLETISIAIETAETGHLVFGTLHTNTAPSTIDRLIEQFPADRQAQIRSMLSTSLKGVVAQTLCKKQKGGRIAALEVLVVNHAVSNLIREGKTFQVPSIMQTAKAEGMLMLNDSLLTLARQKLISPEEAYLRAVDQKEMGSLLMRSGFRGQWSA